MRIFRPVLAAVAVLVAFVCGALPGSTTTSAGASVHDYDLVSAARAETRGEVGSGLSVEAFIAAHAGGAVEPSVWPPSGSAPRPACRFATNSVRSPLRDIPADANIRVLKPDPTGGAQYGVEYKWVNTDGQTVRFRVHGPDGHAPVGSNAAVGDTYRVQVGKRYMDADGNLYPSGVHNPLSPNYDPDAANATHIPWPGLSWPG